MSFDKWNGLTGMGNVISIGNQSFDSIRENNYFFIDKSSLIKEWWDSGDVVTLIIRPRRFGKTLNMSMLNCFFSVNMLEGQTCSKAYQYGMIPVTEIYRELILSYISVLLMLSRQAMPRQFLRLRA